MASRLMGKLSLKDILYRSGITLLAWLIPTVTVSLMGDNYPQFDVGFPSYVMITINE